MCCAWLYGIIGVSNLGSPQLSRRVVHLPPFTFYVGLLFPNFEAPQLPPLEAEFVYHPLQNGSSLAPCEINNSKLCFYVQKYCQNNN
jgi:hypothetical protein